MLVRLRPLASRLRASILMKGAVVALSARIYGAAVQYLTQMYLAREIGTEQLGIYVFAWTWMVVLSFLTPLGFDTSLVRFVASYQNAGDWARVRGVLRTGHRVAIVASLAALGLGVLVVSVRDPAFEHPYTTPVLTTLTLVPVVALSNLYEGIARGFRWLHQVAVPSFALRPSLFLLFAAVAILLLNARTGQAMTIAGAAAVGLTLLLQAIAYRRSLAPHRTVLPDRAERSLWLRTSIPLMLVTSFELLLSYTDIVMLGVLRGPEDVAVYNIAVRTGTTRRPRTRGRTPCFQSRQRLR